MRTDYDGQIREVDLDRRTFTLRGPAAAHQFHYDAEEEAAVIAALQNDSWVRITSEPRRAPFDSEVDWVLWVRSLPSRGG